ncbi:MAG: Ig-like domain-containing protein [Bacteroidota bacterium]
MVRFLQFILLVILAVIVVRCANSISLPPGGPKDVTPPKVIETIPRNGSPGFSTNKFTIKFDEYVTLVDIQSAALISPPMEDMPEFTIKGKSLQVKFVEEPKPNTTYSVYFGEAIVDITEQNPIFNYTYIFSTGDYVDSLSFSGHVYNAFDLLPVESTFVMLYKDNNDTIPLDSLPYAVVPYYLSKTDINGRFQFDGLSDDEYLLFATNDQNSNYFFDQPGEQIAFLDSLVHPTYFERSIKDTTLTDSLYSIEITPDSIVVIADSLLPDSAFTVLDMGINMYMFLSPDTIQRLVKAEVIEKNAVLFAFSQPATDVKFEFVRYPLDSFLYVKDFSLQKDTMYWYLNDPPNDSLEMRLTQFDDTLGVVYLKLDLSKKSVRLRKKDDEEKKKEFLGWKSNVKSNKLDLDKHLEIRFSQPNVRFNNVDSSLLIVGTDSIWDPKFSFTDDLNMKIEFPFEIKEETKYRVYFPDSSFSSWNNIHTKAIEVNFSTLTLSDYGIFTFDLFPTVNQNYILQFLNEDEKLIREFRFNSDTSVTFSYLTPGIYLSKIIFDSNKDNSWSTGNYAEKLQPEEVIYYTKEIKVRGNWEIEEEWEW